MGTGKYKSLEQNAAAVAASGAEIVTVAVRRVNLTDTAAPMLTDYIDPKVTTYLPNTAGCRTVDEAVRVARLARAMSGTSWLKLEVIPDDTYLLPDPVETLRCVCLVSTSPYILVVRADSPARDIAGFHAMAKAQGAKLNYGSAGNGTPLHLGAELYKLMMGVDLTHVAYRGTGPALQGMLAGDVQLMIGNYGVFRGVHEAGQVRVLAIS